MDTSLLERERELSLLTELARGVRHGRGAVVSIDGSAGLGKTRLLAALEDRSERAGVRVLKGSGRELEQDLPYGLVRQLFAPVVSETDATVRNASFTGPASRVEALLVGDTPQADAFALQYGLYWLLANSSVDRPRVVIVDDAQWADRVSLRFLAYAAERIDDLPVLLVVAARPQSRAVPELDAIAKRSSTVQLVLAPLSATASTTIVRTTCPAATAEFAEACFTSTGGNPLLLRQLVEEAARNGGADGAPPDYGELSLEHVGETVLRRLRALDPEVHALAQAAAVVGEAGPLRHAAAVAGLDMDTAALYADALAEAGILLPGLEIRFVHPLVADGIRSAIPPGRLSVAHRQVARLLAAEGNEESASTHLLHVAPAAETWTVDLLRRQARKAAAAGAADVAATLIRRALVEPPAADARGAVLADLGEAELQVGDANALPHLRDARRLAASGEDIERASRLLSTAYVVHGPIAEAADVLEDAVRNLSHDPSDRGALLHAELLALAQVEHTAAARTRTELGAAAAGAVGRTPTERILMAADAYSHALLWTAPASATAASLEVAVDQGVLGDVEPDSPIVGITMSSLIFSGSWGVAARVIDEAASAAQERGNTRALAQALALGSRLARLRGDLVRAENDGRLAVELSARSFPMLLPMSLAVLVMALTTRGDLVAASEVLTEHSAWGEMPPTTPGAMLLLARAGLHVELRQPAEAAADLDRMRGFLQNRGDYPCSWVPEIVRVLTATGREADAVIKAEDHVARAEQWGLPTDHVEAMRCLAQVRGGNDLDLLEEACRHLHVVASPLVRAKVLRDLGAALRRANRRSEARQPLLEALDLASRMQSPSLVEDVRTELAAAGVRPRREAQTGVDALTASEQRIAALAADGLSNPEIAQSLFITRKTVEKHLASAYRKLGINARSELSSALGEC